MKQIKKILALVLVAVMMMALSTVALATGGIDSTTDANKGSITVDNAKSGETYTAYKIFDVTYKDTSNPNDNDPDIYSYTIDSSSPWYSTVKAYADDTANGLTLTAVSGTSTTYVVSTSSAFSAPKFAEALKAAIPTDAADLATFNTSHNAVSLTNGSADNLELGYWFVTTTTGALCNLTTTEPDATIYDKNIVVFEKQESDYTVEVGQTVTYTLTGKVPSTDGYTKYTYKVEDTMSDGLTFNKDVKIIFSDGSTKTVIYGTAVTADGETAYVAADNGGTIAPTPDYSTANKFVVEFDMTKWQKYVNQDITIVYTATVDSDAIQHDEENNTATLTYSNNPNDVNDTDSKTEKEHLYSFNLVIDKYAANPSDANDTSSKLANAEFVLYKRGEGVTTAPASGDYDTVEEGGVTTYYPLTYYKQDATTKAVTWVANKADATKVTTDVNGAGEFDGLKAGSYYLLETKAPDGYNLLKDPIPVVLTATADPDYPGSGHEEPYILSATVNGGNSPVNHEKDNNNTAAKDNDVTASVANNSGTELPSTGGIGTTIFYVVGGLLVAAAIVVLITKRRMAGEE